MLTQPDAIALNGSAGAARTENLPLLFQELLTVIVRLRADRQDVSSAEVFRSQILAAIKSASQNARSRGYTDEDIRLAVFAVIAFLDESILNLRKPIFREWVRRPLQEELFGRHIAGEQFFENVQDILGRRDAEETADVLEVYYLCLLLGYLGKYSIVSRADLRSLMGQIEDKIQRIRKIGPGLCSSWNLPLEGTGAARLDPWFRRLTIALLATAAVSIILFVFYKASLGSGARTLRSMPVAIVLSGGAN